MDVTKPSEIAQLLKRYGIKLRKSWGQNFLINKTAIENILSAAGLQGGETVLEVGPGMGVMTSHLLSKARKVVAIEIDPLLCHFLRERFRNSNFHLIEGDALAQDFKELLPEPYIVVANLPYYITSPFLIKLIEGGHPPQEATILVQLEVANRLAAEPGTREYGSLSVLVQYHCRVKTVFKLHPGNFFPPPKVDSALVKLTWAPREFIPKDEGLMFKVVRTAFSQRRKMLKGLLAREFQLGKPEVERILEEIGLSTSVRGEKLSVADFINLSDLLGGLL